MDMEELNLTEETPEVEEELSGMDYYEIILDEFRDYIADANEATVGLVISTAKISGSVDGLAENVEEVTAIATDILESEAAMKKELVAQIDENQDALREIDSEVDDLTASLKLLQAKVDRLESKCAEKNAVAFCAVISTIAAIAAVIGLFL